jgi:hypothetical protein
MTNLHFIPEHYSISAMPTAFCPQQGAFAAGGGDDALLLRL